MTLVLRCVNTLKHSFGFSRIVIELKFLNGINNHVRIQKSDDLLVIEFWTALWNDESTCEHRLSGRCLEECLDQIIEETGFEKTL